MLKYLCMYLSAQQIALTLFVTSIVAFLLLWLVEENLFLAIGSFGFINVIAVGVLLNNVITTHGITHVQGAKILRTLGLLPNPTEASLLVLTITILASLIISDLWKTLFDTVDVFYNSLCLVFLSLGILLSIYHAFSKRRKSAFEELILRVYVVTIFTGLSFYTFGYALENRQVDHVVFTILSGLQVLSLLWVMASDTNLEIYVPLPTREARVSESILAVCVTISGIFIGHYVIHAHWASVFLSIVFVWNWIQQFFERHFIPKQMVHKF